MKSLLSVLVLSVALASPAMAQTKAAEAAPAPAPAASMADMADGEVRRVDKGASRITLKHGEIKSIDMPPMTMAFQVKDPALLDKVKVGDKVKFKAEKAGSSYVVTAIDVQP